MYDPLYYRAGRWVGDDIDVYHVTGDIYHGTLLSVEPNGVYVLQHPPRIDIPSDDTQSSGLHPFSYGAEKHYSLIYSPIAFFSFRALAGLHISTP